MKYFTIGNGLDLTDGIRKGTNVTIMAWVKSKDKFEKIKDLLSVTKTI